jgi:hypothetical protein
VSQGAAGVRKALFAYDPIHWYVNDVLFYATAPYSVIPMTGAQPTAAEMPPFAHGRVVKVLASAQRQNGDFYRMGAAGPNVWDCPSFTQAAFAQIGFRMPRACFWQRSWLAAGNGIRIRPSHEGRRAQHPVPVSGP